MSGIRAMGEKEALMGFLKERLLHLIETQPSDLTPDLLPFIFENLSTETTLPQEQDIHDLKEKVRPFKLPVPVDPAAPPAEPVEGQEVEELLPVEVEGDMGDVLHDLGFLERAGVGFGKEEAVRLYLSLKTLLHKNPDAVEGEKISSVRLWGKIMGVEKDYIIAECLMSGRQPNPPLPEGEQDPSIVPPDSIGSEAPVDFMMSSNAFVYYVTSGHSSPWRRLPDVEPKTIIAARNIRRFFTGNLDAPVLSKSSFPGRELHYLRAQIARISADCRIAPRGHLADVTDYEGGGELTVGLSEEGTFFGMTGHALCELHKSSWVHASLDLLPQGRCKYYDYGWTPPESNPDAKDPRLEKNRPALQSIHLDKIPKYDSPAWTAHLAGGKAPQYACAVVRSLAWPGAVTVGWGYTFVNFYCGWGVYETGAMFTPPVVGKVLPEPSLPEYKRNEKCKGVAGDLNLEPPPVPEEGQAAAE